MKPKVKGAVTRQRVAYLLAHPDSTTNQVAAHFGITTKVLSSAMCKMRDAGLIPTEFYLKRPTPVADAKALAKANRKARSEDYSGVPILLKYGNSKTREELRNAIGLTENQLRYKLRIWKQKGLLPADFKLIPTLHQYRTPPKAHLPKKTFTPVRSHSTARIISRNPNTVNTHNRDAGKVLVQIDPRTWVYKTPEAAAAFYAQQNQNNA